MEKLLENGVRIALGKEKYTTVAYARKHTLLADEPYGHGGSDMGFAPYELLLASLGSCTAITMRMYAERKRWDLQHVDVQLNMEQETTAEGKHTVFLRDVKLTGNLSDEQRQRLLQIAKACPVAKVLGGKIDIVSRLV